MYLQWSSATGLEQVSKFPVRRMQIFSIIILHIVSDGQKSVSTIFGLILDAEVTFYLRFYHEVSAFLWKMVENIHSESVNTKIRSVFGWLMTFPVDSEEGNISPLRFVYV